MLAWETGRTGLSTLFFGGLHANYPTTDPDQPGQGERTLRQAGRDLKQCGQNPRTPLLGAEGGAGAADALGGAAPLPGAEKAQGDEGPRVRRAERQQRDPESPDRAGA